MSQNLARFRDISLSKFVMASAILLAGINSPVMSEEVTLVLRTQTSNFDTAGSNDSAYFAIYYLEQVDSKSSSKPKLKRVQVLLNHQGRDRDVGQSDLYRFNLNVPVEHIRRVEIGIIHGSNAWHLEGFEYLLERNGQKSRPTRIAVNKWLSGDKNDGGKRNHAFQYYFFDVKPPVFDVAKKKR